MVDARLIQLRLEETAEAAALIRFGASIPLPSLDGMETIMDLLGTGYLFSERDFSHLAPVPAELCTTHEVHGGQI